MKNALLNYLTLSIIYIAFFLFIINQFITNSHTNAFTYIGLVIMTISLIFFTLARIKLGNSFQASAKAEKLVKDGIYKYIRHPVYWFGFTFLLGFILFMKVFIALLILPFIVLIQMKRIKKEEKVLEDKFGNDYLDYKNSTWF